MTILKSTWKWIRNLLIIPLIVGIAIAAFTFVLPKIFGDQKEISYSTEGPTKYLDNPALKNVTVKVNGVETSNLNSYRIRIWNSGDLPIRNLPIRLVFTNKDSNLAILSEGHQTNPPYEFGKIAEEGSDDSSKRYVYELLNPGDEDIITLLLNQSPQLEIYAKAEGLKVTPVATNIDRTFWGKYSTTIVVIASMIAAILTNLITPAVEKYALRLMGRSGSGSSAAL